MRRREFVLTACALVPAALVGCVAGAEAPPATGEMQAKSFEIVKTEEEWRKVLTPAQFRILREHDTERAGSSPLNGEHREGIYHCAGCDLPLYASSAKFESGTGWPSFTGAARPMRLAPRSIAVCSRCAPKCTADDAAVIWVTCSTTARDQQESGTA